MKKLTYVFFLLMANCFPVLASERFSLVYASGRGIGCDEAVQSAYDACQNWLSEFSESHDIVGPVECPLRMCTCSSDYGPANSSCLGFAKYDDKKTCAQEKRVVVKSFRATGIGCAEARHRAASQVYAWAADLSDHYPILKFDLSLRNCFCGGHPIANATCRGSVEYLDCKD